MTTGHRNRRLPLQVLEETRSDSGALVEEWRTTGRIWVGVVPSNQSERWTGNQQVAERSYVFDATYTRTLANLDLRKHRVVCEDRALSISSIVDPKDAHRSLIIIAQEID